MISIQACENLNNFFKISHAVETGEQGVIAAFRPDLLRARDRHPMVMGYALTKNCTLREGGAKGKFVVQRGLTEAIFLPKRKKSDFPKKYTLLDNIGAAFPKVPGFPVKGA